MARRSNANAGSDLGTTAIAKVARNHAILLEGRLHMSRDLLGSRCPLPG
jgi:hypothetical protein